MVRPGRPRGPREEKSQRAQGLIQPQRLGVGPAGRNTVLHGDGVWREPGGAGGGPHAEDHEDGGSDEINVEDLSGELADPQVPKAHAASHKAAGSDPIKLDELAEPDDNATLDASAAKHGLQKKLSGDVNQYQNGEGDWVDLATAKGDLPTHDGTAPAILPAGDSGQMLSAAPAESTGLLYIWSGGLWGLAEFGTGVDGALVCGAGNTTIAGGSWPKHYTTITLASGATLRSGTGSIPHGFVLYASESITGADATSIITVQSQNTVLSGGAPGAGAGSQGGSGGRGGFHLPAIYIYAKHFLGTGKVINDGSDGDDGGDGINPTGTSSGTAGAQQAVNGARIFGISIGNLNVNGGNGGGGVSTGAGGAGGSVSGGDGWDPYGAACFRDMGHWKSLAAWYDAASGDEWRRWIVNASGGGGAGGGRSTTTGAGGAGSGAGMFPWPWGATLGPQAGVAGGAGTAGGAGSGGGAGGCGGVGGIILAVALTIAAGWIFQANGGQAGDGGDGFGWGGGGASGVGGDGGWVILVTMLASLCTITTNGGAQGAVGAAGASGGNPGNQGPAGRAGSGNAWRLVSQAA